MQQSSLAQGWERAKDGGEQLLDHRVGGVAGLERAVSSSTCRDGGQGDDAYVLALAFVVEEEEGLDL